MTKIKHTSRIKIEPSSRDSISSWLDVLTAMLAVSESKRAQIRDELEDHLRSRVDDLLIIGKPEHEAIQTAVGELGETAELAKLITHAHTRTNPRRKIMNATLIAVALGGMSFGGFTLINGTGAPSATPSSSGSVPVVMPEETRRDDGKTHKFDLEQASMYDILVAIADAFDLKMEFSREAAASPMEGFLGRSMGRLQGELTFGQAVGKFKQDFSEMFYGYKLVITDDTMLFESFDEYQRQQIETRVYPTPEWIHTQSEQINYANSLQGLLGVKYNLDYTSIQVIGDSIVVAAPPEIHTEVVKFVADLEEIIGKRNAELKLKLEIENAELKATNEQREADRLAAKAKLRANQQAEREQAAAERKKELGQARIQELQFKKEKQEKRRQAVERIQTEFDSVRSKLLTTKEKLRLVKNKLSSMGVFSNDRQSKEEFDAQQLSLSNTQETLEFELDELEERYMFLRSHLIESQYANLFEGLE